MARWSVDVIGKRLQHLGTVEADDGREALQEAIKRFAVRPALRSKLAVTKVKESKSPGHAPRR
jgi:1,2-phenylacetyl-CoA epoxidase PaaB subunit